MNLFTLTSLFNFLASIICIASAIKVFFVIKSKKRKSISIKYYFYSFLFISIYLFIGALPFFIIENYYFILLSVTLFRPFLIIAGMFLTLIIINLAKFKLIDTLYMYGSVAIILISSVLTIFGISEISDSILIERNIESLMRPENTFIVAGVLITGIYFSLSVLAAFIFYAKFAIKEKLNKVASGKAIMMAIGCFMFFLAGLVKYIIGIAPENFIIASIAASFLFMMGSISFIASVNYKGEKRNYKLNFKSYVRSNEASQADV